MSNWEPSDDRPLIDAPLPSTPTPQTPRAYTPTPVSGPLVDIDEAELKRILSVPPALPRQQLPPALLTPDKSKPGQSTSVSGPVTQPHETETSGANKSWLYREAISRPTVSRLSITPPMTPQETPPITPPITTSMTSQTSQPVDRNYEGLTGQQSNANQWFQPTGFQAPVVHPILHSTLGYQLAPTDWRPPTDPSDPHSGELDVSSDVEQQSSTGVGSRVRQWFNHLSNRNVDDMTRKTKRDLNKLKQKGFDVKYGQRYEIGSGSYGGVYTGIYTPRISTLTDIEGRYIGAAQPGDRFAAKYIQMTYNFNARFETRLYHEIEKHVMKRLASHPYIVSFKMAINLGAKYAVINNTSNDYFYSYDRMFLIMDLADKGDLAQFVDRDKCNDSYAIMFINQLCNGMHYMHTNGIIHGDVYSKNVLLFSGQNRGQLVAKWTDFGRSLARDHWSGSGLTDQEFHSFQRQDITRLIVIFGWLISCVQRVGRRNTGANLQQTRDLMDHLKQDNITLDIALKNIQ